MLFQNTNLNHMFLRTGPTTPPPPLSPTSSTGGSWCWGGIGVGPFFKHLWLKQPTVFFNFLFLLLLPHDVIFDCVCVHLYYS